MKIIYLDTETTGKDPERHDVIQIAGLIEIDGEVKDSFNLTCQPFNYSTIEPEALAVNGVTLGHLRIAQDPCIAYMTLTGILGRWVDKYDKADKFTPAGYNVGFDLEFLGAFFRKNGDLYWGSWQNWRAVDALPIVRFLDYCGRLALPNYQLVTVCAHYGIEIAAHDALSDITATRDLIQRLKDEVTMHCPKCGGRLGIMDLSGFGDIVRCTACGWCRSPEGLRAGVPA